MLKKITLAAVIIFSAVSLVAAPKVKIDQSSKKALAESFIRVICAKDIDGLEKLFAPGFADTLKDMLKFQGNNVGLSSLFDNVTIPAGECEKINRDPAEFRKATEQLMKHGFDKGSIKINGKWYLFVNTIIKSDSKNMVTLCYILAIKNSDACTLFAICSPEVQEKMIKIHGSKSQAIEKIAQLLKAMPEDTKKQFSQVDFKDLKMLAKVVEEGEKQGILTQIDGKWYINFN